MFVITSSFDGNKNSKEFKKLEVEDDDNNEDYYNDETLKETISSITSSTDGETNEMPIPSSDIPGTAASSKNGGSSTSSGGTPVSSETGTEGPDIFDVIEDMNPNFLKAEIDFMSTPLTEKYVALSSNALENIQTKCANDFMMNCILKPQSIMNFAYKLNLNSVDEMNTNMLTDMVNIMSMFANPVNRRLTNEYTDVNLLSVKHQLNKINDASALVFKNSNTRVAVPISPSPVVGEIPPVVPPIDKTPSGGEKKKILNLSSKDAIEQRKKIIQQHENKFKVQIEADHHPRLRRGLKDDNHKQVLEKQTINTIPIQMMDMLPRIIDEEQNMGHHGDHKDEHHMDNHHNDHKDECGVPGKPPCDHHHHDDHDHPPHKPCHEPLPPSNDVGNYDDDNDEDDSTSNRSDRDKTYHGSLGYGYAGDQCMLQHADSLSDPCKLAISDLYTLRSSYYTDYRHDSISAHHNSHGGWPGPDGEWHGHRGPSPTSIIFPVFLLVLTGAIILRRMYGHPYRKYRKQQINSLLTVIEANPLLKAQLEAETGFPLPEKCNDKHPCGDRKSFSFIFLRVVGVILGSLLLSASSVMITAHLIMARYDATGDVPSPMMSALILLSILLAEIGTVFLFYKGVRFVLYRGESSNGSNRGAGTSNGDGGDNSAHRFGQRIRYVYNDLVGRMMTTQNNGAGHENSLYTPLSQSVEENGTIGSYVAPSAPTPVLVRPGTFVSTKPVQVQPHQQVYYTQSASPVTSVTLI